jgi:hypothetical protein
MNKKVRTLLSKLKEPKESPAPLHPDQEVSAELPLQIPENTKAGVRFCRKPGYVA